MEVYLLVILLVFLIFYVGFVVLLSYNIVFAWLLPLFMGGAFFAKTTDELLGRMIALANIKSGDKAVDIGSGDGRLVIAMAKAGAEAHGYEINPFLVLLSKYNIKKAGMEKKAFIHWKNFWKIDFSHYNIVVLYQIAFAMERLEKKLNTELRPGTKVVSNYFVFPNWQSVEKNGEVRLYKK